MSNGEKRRKKFSSLAEKTCPGVKKEVHSEDELGDAGEGEELKGEIAVKDEENNWKEDEEGEDMEKNAAERVEGAKRKREAENKVSVKKENGEAEAEESPRKKKPGHRTCPVCLERTHTRLIRPCRHAVCAECIRDLEKGECPMLGCPHKIETYGPPHKMGDEKWKKLKED